MQKSKKKLKSCFAVSGAFNLFMGKKEIMRAKERERERERENERERMREREIEREREKGR